MFAFGRDKGPTQGDHEDTLEQRIEKGYMCGETLDVPPMTLWNQVPMQHKTQEVDELLQRICVLCAMDMTTWC